jgi:methionyl aminopeptidase
MPSIKNPEAIAKMEEAGRIVGKVHNELKKMIKPGVTLLELDAKAEEIIRAEGAEPSFLGYGGFPASICASVNEVLVHGIPNNYALKEGDLVSIDVGAYKDGYHGDAAFTMGVGNISAEAENISKATKAALQAAINVAKPGATIGDIGYAVEEVAKKYGVELTREYTGHGIGENLHEDPNVPNYGTPGTGPVLKEGMTIAIEPMFIFGTEKTWVDPLDD